jgi:hypothetical protein
VNQPIEAGTAEAYLSPELVLSQQSEAANLKFSSMESQFGSVESATLDVYPPFPEKLWLQVRFEVREKPYFVKQPVVVRGKVFRDETPIARVETVVGKNIMRGVTTQWPLLLEFDVMSGLSPVPDSLLVHARLKGEVMPFGTDEDSLDPAGPATTTEIQATLMSNPLRISFHREAPGS